jgi:3-oxoadipate enol-lactonase
MAIITAHGTDIYYEDHGPQDAPAIVFSPLVFTDTSVYASMVEAFSGEYRVITYDHRGQGKSSHPVKRADLQTTTQDAIDLIEKLKLAPCHFVGNSLGAYVGMNIAVRRGDLLRSCTLMGAVSNDETPYTIKRMDGFIESMKKEGAKTGMHSFTNTFFGASFNNSPDAAVKARHDQILERLDHLTPGELDTAKQIWHRQSITPEQLKSIDVPVLILVGDEDTAENLAAYRVLSGLIPHVTYKTLHHVGYAMVIEQPQEVTNLLYDFLQKADADFAVHAASKAGRTRVSKK